MDYYKLKVLNNKRKVIIFVFILVILLGLGYYYFIYQEDDNEVIVNDEVSENDGVINDNIIIVDIKGYVNKPGVYSFNESDNARINDLINKAGGLIKDADTSMINLSKRLEDEMIIIVYSKTEVANYTKTQDNLKKKLELCEKKLKNDACIKEKEEVSNNKININEASIDELKTLSGIGDAKAKAIIEYRKKSKFKSIDDIMNVEGIGESLFASIKESITV